MKSWNRRQKNILLLGLGIQACCKISVFCINLACLAVSFFCFSEVSGNCYAGFAGSFCYCFSVYYIYINMVRGSLGEMTAFAFLPLYGLGLWRLYTWPPQEKGYWKSGIPLGIGLLGIWLSCIPVAFIFSGFTLLTALLLAPRTFRRRTFAVLALSVCAVMVLTAGLTIPYAEKMLSGNFYADTAAGNSFAARALLPSQLLLPFQGNSNYDHEPQDHSGHIGLGLPFLIFIMLWTTREFLEKKKSGSSVRRQIRFLIGLCAFSAFLCTMAFPGAGCLIRQHGRGSVRRTNMENREKGHGILSVGRNGLQCFVRHLSHGLPAVHHGAQSFL